MVLEIDLTSGSLDKLPIYAALSIPEIWRYDGNKLEIFVLNLQSLSYDKSDKSLIFYWLNVEKIPQLIGESLEVGQTITLKKFRRWLKETYKQSK